MTAGPHSRISLAVRIALASALFGLVVAGGAIAVGFWTLSSQLDGRAAAEMHGRRDLLLHIVATVPTVDAIGEAKERFADLFFGHDDLHLALVEPRSERLLSASSDIAALSVTALGHATAAPDTVHTWWAPDGTRFSGTHGLAQTADGAEVRFFLSANRHRDAALLADFIQSTLLALPLLLLIVAAGAGLIARTGLAPLRRFNQLAASIGTQSLSARVSLAGLPGELEEMAREFNKMLERIAAGYQQLQDFSGDLAHEMRTPVATLLGRTQVALSQTRTAAQLREVLEGNVEELERLSTLISDMLFIARADHNVTPVQTAPVDLREEALRVADYLSLIADERKLTLRVSGEPCAILADRLLVQRAITNLLSNAIRHAFEGSAIAIEAGDDSRNATLSVTNEGETIAPANLTRIFERFYRVDQSRSRGAGGSGLGLAIVRSIAVLHDGAVTVTSESGRTTFTLSFPCAGAQAGAASSIPASGSLRFNEAGQRP